MPKMSINVVDNPDKVSLFWDWLTSHRDFVAADSETTGTNVYAPDFKIRLFQFGDTDSGWAVPFQNWRGLVTGALSWMSEHRVKTVYHNAAFDLRALESEGYTPDYTNVEDTFVWASLCGYAEESRALKTIASREFGPWAAFGQKLLDRGMKNAGWSWATVPLDFRPYTSYGVVDTILTARYRDSLADREKFRWHHGLEISALELTNRMARNGLSVNTEYALEQQDVLDEMEAKLLAKLKTYGVESASQNAAVAIALKDAGVLPEVVKLTGTGQIAVDKEFLSTIDHPVAELVLAARSLHKTKSYLTAMLEFAGGNIGTNEIIHPDIRSIEARTGRMSVGAPALQQLPSVDEKDPESMIVRRAVVPRTPDEVLVGADFGQIELRMFASMSKDQNLLDVLNQMDEEKAAGSKNADFFVALGRDLYHDPHFQKSDPRRTKLKSTVYALQYGGGAAKIAQVAKVPQAEINQTIKELSARYPAFGVLGEDAIVATKNGWQVDTPTGRVFRVRERGERRKLNNYRIQGHSAEVLKMALTNVAEAGYKENLMLPVHDEIIMSVPKDQAEQATKDLVEAMNAVVDKDRYGVAVQASPATPASDWAALSH